MTRLARAGDVDEGAGTRFVPAPGQPIWLRLVEPAGKQALAVLRPRDLELGVIKAG